MTDSAAPRRRSRIGLAPRLPDAPAAGRRMRLPSLPKPRVRAVPIIPKQNVAGRSLIFVVAIMTFLASLTAGAVQFVADTSAQWQSQISREATIQIRPGDDTDMVAAMTRAREIALSFDGVVDVSILDDQSMQQLLEPWLGEGLSLGELPVPQLIVVTIDERRPPDFAAMSQRIRSEIPNASLDDHRTWVDRLVRMADTSVMIGLTVLVLMLAATVLTVVFATRGAMASNETVIEVLHFVGAESRFIARQFRHHFLLVGLKGAAIGGVAAIILFASVQIWSTYDVTGLEAEQASVLFGNFALGIGGTVSIGVIVVIIAFLTALTSQFTVLRHLGEVDSGIGSDEMRKR